MKAHVLLVEDDDVTRMALSHHFRYAGYTVTEAADGETAIDLIETDQFEVIVTDIALGPVDGMEVLHAARLQPYRPEVIVLTGHGTFETAVLAVREGAIDYLVKPTTGEALIASVERAAERQRNNAQLRAAARSLISAFANELHLPGAAQSASAGGVGDIKETFYLALGALVIGATRRDVSFQGRRVSLTPIEYAILRYLAERPNQVCLSRDIVAASHQIAVQDDTEAQALVKPHVHNLRKKLAPEYFTTERGFGFRLINPDEFDEAAHM